MAQFDVYENPNADQSRLIPFVLDIQSDLLGSLATRVVVPLYLPEAADSRVIERLAPVMRVRGKSVVCQFPELAGVPAYALETRVANLSSARDDIVAALDLLITGI